MNSANRHKESGSSGTEKRCLVLGAGLVSEPLIEFLHRDPSLSITLGSLLKEDADSLANKYDRVEPVAISVMDQMQHLANLIDSADIVVSLLPYSLHHVVAECCINSKVNMVTASYCNPDMQALHNRAVEAGVTIVNEVGLDPGLDHLLAMECIDSIHEFGGKVDSFISYCGGLPAPECSDNALRYKFSWSPHGVLLNTLANAKYLSDSKVVEIPAGGELMKTAEDMTFLPGFSLEGFPNRDSVKYAQLYGIAAECHTILRGTLRYRGFSHMIQGLQLLGLIDPNPHPALHPNGPDITWRQLVCTLLNLSTSDIFYENLKSKIGDKIGQDRLVGVEELGFLMDDPVQKLTTPLDTLSHFLSKKLALGPNDRDLVILRHNIGVKWPAGHREMREITLVVYGESNKRTAMARTVSLPAAITAQMVLSGEIQAAGMVLPLSPDIYRPLLSRLRKEGIVATENIRNL